MRTTLFILSFFLCLGRAFATGQTPDYLIMGHDTVPIFNNPLEQYFDKVGKRELIDFLRPLTQKEIEEYVTKQMDVRE